VPRMNHLSILLDPGRSTGDCLLEGLNMPVAWGKLLLGFKS
jgi:hypothetical protein